MKNKIQVIYIFIIIALAAFSVGLLTSNINSSNKLAYIDLSAVFDKFELKKELSIKFEKESISYDDLLKEMDIGLKQLAQEVESNPSEQAILNYRKKEVVFLEKREEFENQKLKKLEEYDAQILKQLNQYVKDYGKTKGVNVILGTTGQGNLMYCDEEMNITDDIIAYINTQYQGANHE